MPLKQGSEAFSILKLLRKAPSQTPRPDVPLFSFGRLLGTPSWWDFSGSVTFDSLLDYHGNIQVELWVWGKQVEVRRVGVRMWTAISGFPEPKQGKMKYTARDHVQFDGFEPGLSVEEAKALLQAATISFEEVAVANASETVVRLDLPNKTEMHFFMMGGRPSLASIQAYSDHEGA
ncbi:hypothetical protein HNQ96_000751 [Aminobacter lissarensis]|uniref:Uncharacterized protein n=1 Tax=Aminobacter carboxidus TaxID=376165 RepID=A0A8E2BBA7_9HYPH|nr:hypothetical protein [Aminobacter lissarensis]MBB6464904.1 hypothetical protein [Aminobacter lissarensis]